MAPLASIQSRLAVLPCLVLLPLIWLSGCMPETQSQPTPIAASASVGPGMEAPRRIFISGHSLTDRPFPDFLEAIAKEADNSLQWNMQHLPGSSLRMRTRGDGAWSGYRAGTDRNGQPIDVLDELGTGGPVDPYDTLILTEVHTLLESLIWNDTIGNALDYEARFVASNPAGQVYLYSSWLDVDNLDDPSRWVAYERAAARAWQCTAFQITQELAAEGRAREIHVIPVAEGLAALVERAVSAQGLPGLTGASPKATMHQLFTDDVHLTETGSYYVALVAHAALYGAVPEEPWAPDIDPGRAEALQGFARQFMTSWRQQRRPAPLDCSGYFAGEFAKTYLAYVRDTKWREEGWLRAHYKWARFSVQWPWLLRSDSNENPFRNKAMARD